MNSVALIGSLRTSGSPPIPHATKRCRVMVAVPRRKSDGFAIGAQPVIACNFVTLILALLILILKIK